jgi:hypothetical protein
MVVAQRFQVMFALVFECRNDVKLLIPAKDKKHKHREQQA